MFSMTDKKNKALFFVNFAYYLHFTSDILKKILNDRRTSTDTGTVNVFTKSAEVDTYK